MTGTRRIVIAAVLVAGSLVTGSPVLRAQASRQLAGFAVGLSLQGFDPISHHEGWLNEGESESLWTQLDRGSEYAIAGACDDDCLDLDVKVFTSSGRLVIRDVSTDSVPLVRYRPAASGLYRVEVVMYRCSIEPCEYRLGVFER